MSEFLTTHLNEIISGIIGLIFGAGLTLTIKCSNNNKVVQKNNTVGGDQAGRDITK